MKKGIIKMMTAALAMTSMASCSDDLGVSNGNYQDKADLVGSLEDCRPNFTRMGMSEIGTAPWDGGTDWGLVWTQGDEVRVFTLEQLTYNYYELLSSSYNSPQGRFALREAESALADGKKYAITDAQFVYGVSATKEGEALLTYTIPYKYKAAKTHIEASGDVPAYDVRKFPAPYWGMAEEEGSAEDLTLNVSFQPMTAFMRVDLAKLPAGTKYVVFTTHGDKYAMKDKRPNKTTGDPEEYTVDADGFQVTDDATILTAVEGNTETNYTWKDVAKTTNGQAESLSGTFNMLLKDGQQLAVDKGLKDKDDDEWGFNGTSRLVTRDEIIVKLDENTPAVFYVPIIANKYQNLHVIAAKAISKYQYRYVGSILKTFNNWTAERGHYYFLSMNLLNLGETDALELNAAILNVNTRADRTSILNIENIKDAPANVDQAYVTALNNKLGTSYTLAQFTGLNLPKNRILVQGVGSLVLNIEKVSATKSEASGVSPLRSDLGYLSATNGALYITDDKTASQATEATNMVEVNLPHALAGGTTDTEYQLAMNLPTYNATIGSIDGKDLAKLDAFVQGSKTSCVSGLDLVRTVDGKEVVEDAKVASVNLVAGVNNLNLLPKSEGDIYFKNIGAVDGKDPEIKTALNILTDKQVDVRVDNALIKGVNFVNRAPSNESYVYTTGSSAFQSVTGATYATDYTVTATTTAPVNVTLHSYWTGAALNGNMTDVIKNYDNGKVYTVAQLASMGMKLDGSTTAEYSIPTPLVGDMWLGAEDNRWIGPAATVEGFKFNGNNVALRKMNIEVNATPAGAGTPVIYVDDPHYCCTTCGFKPAVYAGAGAGSGAIKVESFGLIRSYVCTAGEAEITNVNLSDVMFDTSEGISNIGSIIGKVDAKSLLLNNNTVVNPKINVAGANVGGLAGYVKLTDRLFADGNRVKEDGEEIGYIKSTKDSVGGMFGRIEAGAWSVGMINANPDPVVGTGNTVELRGNVETTGSYAGGVVGYAKTATASTDIIAKTSVKLAKVEAASYAGGLAGAVKAGRFCFNASGTKANGDIVKVPAIVAKTGSYAGGFAGAVDVTEPTISDESSLTVNYAQVTSTTGISAANEYAGGLFGSLKTAKEAKLNSATIKAGTIEATEGFAAGEVGYAEGAQISFGKASNSQASNIAVNKIKGAYALGGLIGGNASNAPVVVTTAARTAENKKPAAIDIVIKDWECTKVATEADAEAYFWTPSSNSKRAGMISNVIGYMNAAVSITNATDLDGTTKLFTVTDYLSSEKKIALGYKYHRDEIWNAADGKNYWGDVNGYVGYGKAPYTINGKVQVAQSEFNLFKGDDTYATATSLLPQGN